MDEAELIAWARKSAGLTQAALARRAGTSQPVVARYETGASTPTVRTLRRLLRAAGYELTLAAEPLAGFAPADLSGITASALREHRTAIRDAARSLGIRHIRITGQAASGTEPRGSDSDLLVDFPVEKKGLWPLLTLACRVQDLTGLVVDVLTTELLTEESAARATASAVPL